MPVLTKQYQEKLETILSQRYGALFQAFSPRPLKSSKEGCAKGHWVEPDRMCGTKGTALDLRLAIEDFKTILDEIKKLK